MPDKYLMSTCSALGEKRQSLRAAENDDERVTAVLAAHSWWMNHRNMLEMYTRGVAIRSEVVGVGVVVVLRRCRRSLVHFSRRMLTGGENFCAPPIAPYVPKKVVSGTSDSCDAGFV
jgi:hypothetical protein